MTDSTSSRTGIPALPAGRPQRRFQNLRTITALILREMSTTYGRSPGGYLWAILEPLGMILVMAIAFSLLFRTPSLGTNFILFYATGFLPFRMYSEIQSVTAAALRYSRGLLAYPAVSYIDALLARFILKALTHLLISYLIMTGIMTFLEIQLVMDFEPIMIAFAAAALLGFGIGSLNCLLFELFPVYKSIWSMVTKPLMIMSAVIYIYEDLPEAARDVLWYNPLAHLTGLSRTGFYSYYEPSYISLTYVLTIGLVSTVFGLMLLRRYNRKLMIL